MSLPQVGKIYTFTCMVFPDKRLNLCGSAGNGGNVAMINADENEITIEEQWKYHSSGKLLAMKNTSCVLDRYAASGTQYNNADVWENDPDEDANQIVSFEETIFPNTVKIRLASTNLYLRANAGNGTSGGKSTTSAGNAYWGVSTGEDNELWVFSEVGATSGDEDDTSTTNLYAELNWNYVFANNSYNLGYYGYDPNGTQSPYYHAHKGIDIICAEGVPMYAPANATVYAVGAEIGKRQTPLTPNTYIDDATGSGSMGYFIVLKMDDPDPYSGKAMYVRYLHMESLPTHRYNDRITKGDFVGYVGNTGASDTAHLHLDINTMDSNQWIGTNMNGDNTINPVNFFPNVSFPSHYYNVGYYGN